MNARQIDKLIKKALPVVLLVLVVYLYIALFTEFKHTGLTLVEFGLLGYFGAELVVKRWLADSWREFFRKNWLKIVLILPFLRVFRVLTAFGIVSRSLMPIVQVFPYAQKLTKLPMLLKKAKPFGLALLGYLSYRNREREQTEKPR